MSDMCPVAVRSYPNVRAKQKSDSVLDSHLLMLKQKRLCDVIFTFENSTEQIEAHELYLRERSPVFDVQFRKRKLIGKRKVEILNATPGRFRQFLEFLYADKFQVDIAGALDLLNLAVAYDVQPLKRKCEAFITTQIKVGNALEAFETAYRHEREDLLKKAGDFLAKNAGTLWPKLMEAQEFTLTYLFRRDDLTVKECELFEFLYHWGCNRTDDTNDLKGVLKNLIYLVRYTCMTPNEFTTIVVPTGLLSAEEIVQIYSFFAGDLSERSEIADSMNFTVTPRKAEIVEKLVYFSMIRLGSHSGTVPMKGCVSFLAKIDHNACQKVWCESSMKRPTIKGILIHWPRRKVQNSMLKDETLNFKVALKWCIGAVHDH